MGVSYKFEIKNKVHGGRAVGTLFGVAEYVDGCRRGWALKPQESREVAERHVRMETSRQETIAIVESGVCPLCGSAVKRNRAITGWWQCEQYGAETHRARPEDPACSWQGFTA